MYVLSNKNKMLIMKNPKIHLYLFINLLDFTFFIISIISFFLNNYL